jgi:hypothetical protein
MSGTRLLHLLNSQVKNVAPLACLVAQTIRKYDIDYESAHFNLQIFIKQH